MSETRTYDGWKPLQPELYRHEEKFRLCYGSQANQYMDLELLNMRLAAIGLDCIVAWPKEPAVPPIPADLPDSPDVPDPPPLQESGLSHPLLAAGVLLAAGQRPLEAPANIRTESVRSIGTTGIGRASADSGTVKISGKPEDEFLDRESNSKRRE